MLPGEKVYRVSWSGPESQSPRWAGDEGAGLRGLFGGVGSPAGGSPGAARGAGQTGRGSGFASRGVLDDGGFLLAPPTSEPRSGLGAQGQKCLGAQRQPSPTSTPLRRAAGPDPDSLFSLTSPLPTHTNPDEGNQSAAGNYYELFAAALGNLEWLRFCLSRGRDKIPADDKVRPWSLGQEMKSSVPQKVPHIVVPWQRAACGAPTDTLFCAVTFCRQKLLCRLGCDLGASVLLSLLLPSSRSHRASPPSTLQPRVASSRACRP